MKSTQTILAVLVLATLGCGQTKVEKEKAKEEEPAKPKMPEMPEGNELGVLTSDALVKTEYNRIKRDTYTTDPAVEIGSLAGVCVFDQKVNTPRRYQPGRKGLDLKGEDAIREPMAQEEKYYGQLPHSRLDGIYYGEQLAPDGVVAILPGLKIGRRAILNQAALMVKDGVIRPGDGSNYGVGVSTIGHKYSVEGVQFAPQFDSVLFTTWDKFPCRLQMCREGHAKPLFEETVASEVVEDEEKNQHAPVKPNIFQTVKLEETGHFVVTCTRHPWQRAHLFVVDNPYVGVSVPEHSSKTHSRFTIKEIPPGTHKLQVWHPLYEAVQKTIDVEIKKDQETVVVIEFKLPPEVKANVLKQAK